MRERNDDSGNKKIKKNDSNDDESGDGVEEEEEEEVVLSVFLRCPTFCEALTRSSAVAIVSESFEGFACCGGLSVFFPPLSSISCP